MDGNIIEGKAFGCWIYQPDIRLNPIWSLRLIPSEIEIHRFKKNGHELNIETQAGKKIGLSVSIYRKVKHMDDVLERPLLFDKNKNRLELFEELPDGSNVLVKYNEWEAISKKDNKIYRGLDLISVMLLDETPSIF
tara:strand:- start:934 stop:1341 length:408 start_codon:yes stop_codon:yes gene_type:complete